MARSLRSMLDEYADPVRAKGEAKYLKLDHREVLGLPAADADAALSRFVQEFCLAEDLDVLGQLFNGSFEEAWCAVWMLAAQPAFSKTTWAVTET